jgi:GT2 family glycosyltransferase
VKVVGKELIAMLISDDQRLREQVTLVVATRDRWPQLRVSLPHHGAPTVVVDNGSRDGTPALVRRHFPWVDVVELNRNHGACARNVGVARAVTPYVAFADDDSWWEETALPLAAAVFEEFPRLGLIAGRILVGAEQKLDPVCRNMSTSPLGTESDLPGPSILGFVACGAAIRRDAFWQAGGFDEVIFFFGEEERFALDMAAAGWGLAYVDSVVAHHHPAGVDRSGRAALAARNALLTAVMRRPWPAVCRQLTTMLTHRGDGRVGLLNALPRLPGALKRRRALPGRVNAAQALLDRS